MCQSVLGKIKIISIHIEASFVEIFSNLHRKVPASRFRSSKLCSWYGLQHPSYPSLGKHCLHPSLSLTAHPCIKHYLEQLHYNSLFKQK